MLERAPRSWRKFKRTVDFSTLLAFRADHPAYIIIGHLAYHDWRVNIKVGCFFPCDTAGTRPYHRVVHEAPCEKPRNCYLRCSCGVSLVQGEVSNARDWMFIYLLKEELRKNGDVCFGERTVGSILSQMRERTKTSKDVWNILGDKLRKTESEGSYRRCWPNTWGKLCNVGLQKHHKHGSLICISWDLPSYR